jgi:hypothetical protein
MMRLPFARDRADLAPFGFAMKTTRVIHLMGLGMALLFAAARGASSEQPLPNAERLYAEFSQLFRKYYPDVVSQRSESGVSFEFRTRMFMVHQPLKTGEWQEARAEKGPIAGGILCRILLYRGPYVGAAMLPQTFDVWYFKTTVIAPYSAAHGVHLYVAISYPTPTRAFPKPVDAEFERAFFATCDRFERYLD